MRTMTLVIAILMTPVATVYPHLCLISHGSLPSYHDLTAGILLQLLGGHSSGSQNSTDEVELQQSRKQKCSVDNSKVEDLKVLESLIFKFNCTAIHLPHPASHSPLSSFIRSFIYPYIHPSVTFINPSINTYLPSHRSPTNIGVVLLGHKKFLGEEHHFTLRFGQFQPAFLRVLMQECYADSVDF